MSRKSYIIDSVNKRVQFEVKESCHSVSFYPVTSEGDVYFVIRVELVSKNKKNQLLYDLAYNSLKAAMKPFMPSLKNLIPFAIDKNLRLTGDNYLLVTVSWSGTGNVTKFETEPNLLFDETAVPLHIKEDKYTDTHDINTEHYPILMIPKGGGAESFVTDVSASGKVSPKKILLTPEFVESQLNEGDEFYILLTSPNQDVTLLNGSVYDYYLIGF